MSQDKTERRAELANEIGRPLADQLLAKLKESESRISQLEQEKAEVEKTLREAAESVATGMAAESTIAKAVEEIDRLRDSGSQLNFEIARSRANKSKKAAAQAEQRALYEAANRLEAILRADERGSK